MKNLKGLPERWAISMVAEKNHPRMEEFKDFFIQYNFMFNCEYYGFNVRPFKEHESLECVSEYLPLGVTLITLDQFFEALDSEGKPEWQPKRGELVEVSDSGVNWELGIFYDKCGDYFAINHFKDFIPTCYCLIRKTTNYKVTQSELLDFYASQKGIDKDKIEII